MELNQIASRNKIKLQAEINLTTQKETENCNIHTIDTIDENFQVHLHETDCRRGKVNPPPPPPPPSLAGNRSMRLECDWLNLLRSLIRRDPAGIDSALIDRADGLGDTHRTAP